jgi:hypothetical protein
LRFVNWVIRAWEDIQNQHAQWNFLRKNLSFVSNGTQQYSLTDMGATDLRVLKDDSMRCYLTATGVADEQFLDPMPWEDFRNTYLYGVRQNGRPNTFSIDPADKSLWFDRIPPVGLTFVGNYFCKPVILALDADIPSMPDNFHMAIVYRAMLKYSGYEAAQEAKQEAAENYSSLMGALRVDQLPSLTLGGSLA